MEQQAAEMKVATTDQVTFVKYITAAEQVGEPNVSTAEVTVTEQEMATAAIDAREQVVVAQVPAGEHLTDREGVSTASQMAAADQVAAVDLVAAGGQLPAEGHAFAVELVFSPEHRAPLPFAEQISSAEYVPSGPREASFVLEEVRIRHLRIGACTGAACSARPRCYKHGHSAPPPTSLNDF